MSVQIESIQIVTDHGPVIVRHVTMGYDDEQRLIDGLEIECVDPRTDAPDPCILLDLNEAHRVLQAISAMIGQVENRPQEVEDGS